MSKSIEIEKLEENFSLTNVNEYSNLWVDIQFYLKNGLLTKAFDCYIKALKLMETEINEYNKDNSEYEQSYNAQIMRGY